jgi:hypothetical protein
MKEEEIKKLIQEEVKNQLKGGLFTARKLTDTPTDSLQVVNRKYVTLNGTSANRPTSSVIGQRYFDTTIGKPIYWNGTGFVDAAGNYV